MVATEAFLELVFVKFRGKWVGEEGVTHYKSVGMGVSIKWSYFQSLVRCLPQSLFFVLFCSCFSPTKFQN